MESTSSEAKKQTLQEKYADIKLEDTIITDDMVDQIPKEDWPYYYIDPNVKCPEIAKKFTPNIYTVFFNYGYKKPERMIFPESEGYTEEEEAKYQKFEDYLKKNKYHLPESLTKRRKMRFLYGNDFNNKATYKNILSTIEFRHEYLPIILNDEMKELIDSGMMYIHGRDKCFRPIYVIQAVKITEAKAELDNIMLAEFFVTFYGMENMTLPGKIENWVTINDMANLSMRKLPTKFISKVLKLFQAHLKCRGRQFIQLNVTFGVRAIWKMLSPFIDANTHLRSVVTKDSTHLYLEHMCHPSQVEERYGGSAPNVTQYWPPQYVSDEFGHDPEHINEAEQEANNDVPLDERIDKHDVEYEDGEKLETE